MPLFSKEEVLNKIISTPVVPVIYNDNADLIKNLIRCSYNAGIMGFEFTNRGAHALAVFKEAIEFVHAECPGMALGIGTVFTKEDAKVFVDLKADFIVQPVTTPSVAHLCKESDLLWIPGAATVNEIYNAMTLGAEIVKIFPGSVLGPAFLKALRGPLPEIKIMVTGGIEANEANINSWLSAGASCVGIGSQLFLSEAVAKKDFNTITVQIFTLLKSIRKK